MKWLYIPYFFLFIICLFLGFIFAEQNPTSVPLEFFGNSLPPVTVSIWVLGALAIGAVLGIVFTLPIVWQVKAMVAKINKQLLNCQKELDKLRTTPFSER